MGSWLKPNREPTWSSISGALFVASLSLFIICFFTVFNYFAEVTVNRDDIAGILLAVFVYSATPLVWAYPTLRDLHWRHMNPASWAAELESRRQDEAARNVEKESMRKEARREAERELVREIKRRRDRLEGEIYRRMLQNKGWSNF